MRHIKTAESGAGPWDEKLFVYPPGEAQSMKGDEIHSEFYVEYHHLASALYALQEQAESFTHLVSYTEIASVEQDLVPLGPAKH